jgi:hypothetical protein
MPSTAVQGDTGFVPPYVHQWVNIARNWCKFVSIPSHKLNRIFFMWTLQHAVNGNVKN